MFALGVEVKTIDLALAAEQRNGKHPVTDRDGTLYTTDGYLEVSYIKRQKNQSSFVIGSLTGRSLYCALVVLDSRLLPFDPPLMMKCERC